MENILLVGEPSVGKTVYLNSLVEVKTDCVCIRRCGGHAAAEQIEQGINIAGNQDFENARFFIFKGVQFRIFVPRIKGANKVSPESQRSGPAKDIHGALCYHSQRISPFYRIITAAIIMVNLKDPESVFSIAKWYNFIRTKCGCLPILIVSNNFIPPSQDQQQYTRHVDEEDMVQYIKMAIKTIESINDGDPVYLYRANPSIGTFPLSWCLSMPVAEDAIESPTTKYLRADKPVRCSLRVGKRPTRYGFDYASE